MEGKWVCGASGPLDEITARKYTRGMVAGLTYLHAHVRYSYLVFFSVFLPPHLQENFWWDHYLHKFNCTFTSLQKMSLFVK